MRENERIIIIGGGLTGLTLAYLLSKKNINATVLEASSRLGGRIQTTKGALLTPLELGATWFSDIHPNLLALIDELGLQKFLQFSQGTSLFQTDLNEPPQRFVVPENQMSSYRLAGGTQILTDTLAKKLPKETILLNSKVTAIKETENGAVLETDTDKILEADKVIVCVPPQLVSTSVMFSPRLPDALHHLLPTVQTWMAGSIKFTLEYDSPFWRNEGYSGILFSHVGIVAEMHDHTNFEENKFGFTGFLDGAGASYSFEDRRRFVLQHLANLLGVQALNPTAYFDKVWTDEFVLGDNPVIPHPHYNNGHPLLQQSYMNGKLFFGVTETATQHGGYMEGAVIAAQSVADKIR
ncbi:FAD-dependent oxidoreductase [Olivibacter sp. SDN3]|uniref:flavin monoamine oxidase family protein n=1 Tax=Olivibacter sp. SDN3 TaxID=2764720 RepID=UPI0016515032|nr:NAD(P)/FAD-dependent oxidoreductase [Olivibacter sp. SDN3]QNL52217.1 FAD-dependent oxidoreductase [Olivibacter sp. SDN3]